VTHRKLWERAPYVNASYPSGAEDWRPPQAADDVVRMFAGEEKAASSAGTPGGDTKAARAAAVRMVHVGTNQPVRVSLVARRPETAIVSHCQPSGAKAS
jgi:hypothetical protein